MNGRKPGTNWPVILQALGLAFTFLSVLVAGLMAYSYMSGSTASRLADHERRIDMLERRR